MWFEKLTGFREHDPDQVRSLLTLEGQVLSSQVNGAQYQCGELETPSLGELRGRISKLNLPLGRLKVSELVGNAQDLHADAENQGALFQVASQFNLLEMVSPSITPEHGVGIYERDPTQGPACAIACGAGTIYRNYYVPIGGRVGQTSERQVNCLSDLGVLLQNTENRLWEMHNGYLITTERALQEISARIGECEVRDQNLLRESVRVGLQWETQVTLESCTQTVQQAYCSALPVAYNAAPQECWCEFAKLILEAAYEATLSAAVLNLARTGNGRVFLTLLGGGAFGNRESWIIEAIDTTLERFSEVPLDVRIVSYLRSRKEVQTLIEKR